MRSTLQLIACALAVTTAPAFAANRSFPVPGFDRLRVDAPYTVHVRTGSHPSVNAQGPQRKLDRLTVENRDGTLVISTEKSAFNLGWSKLDQENVVIEVTVPMLRAASLTGSGDMTIDRIKTPAFDTSLVGSGDVTISRIDTSKLSASVGGSGDLTLAGHAEQADALLRGSGDLHAGGLVVGILSANLTGSGDLAVGPTREARGSLVGSGDITVAGHPVCKFNRQGSGDVHCG